MTDFLQVYRTLKFDKRLIGLDDSEILQNRIPQAYCTPMNAVVIGRLGYDSVHFCFIPQLHENCLLEEGVVYAVSPEVPDHAVEPVAKNFLCFLSLIYSCNGASLLEQVSYLYRGRGQFVELLQGPYSVVPPEKALALQALKDHFPLPIIDDPFGHIKSLQNQFLMEKVPFSKAFSLCHNWIDVHDRKIKGERN